MYSYGIFFKSLSAEFSSSRAVISGAYSMFTLLSGFLGVFLGKISDKFGARLTVTISGFFLGLGYILMSQVDSIWQLYLFFGVVVAIGMSGCWAPLISNVGRWFVEKRGLMTGIVASGIGLGTILIPPLANSLIARYDWRMSYIILGSAVLILITSIAQVIRRNPQNPTLLPKLQYNKEQSNIISVDSGISLEKALRRKEFWMVCFLYFYLGLSQLTVMVHIVPFTTDLGFAATDAAKLIAFIGASSIAGRIGMGAACDKIGAKWSFVILMVVGLVSLVWLQFAVALWMLFIFSIVFGFMYGGMVALQSLSATELFGQTALGAMVGSFTFAYTIGGTVGPVFGGYIFDVNDSYTVAFLVYIVFALVASITAFVLKPPRNR